MKTDFDYSWIKNRPIAHRGLFKNPEVPENTLLAFEKAISHGYPIELDIQITKDKKIVVFHDEDLSRLCSDRRNVCSLKLSELTILDILNTNNKIPSFKDVLKLVSGKVPLLIEIKNNAYNGEIEDVLYNELIDYDGEFAIQSFNPFTVNHFRKLNKRIPRGIISGVGKDFELGIIKKFILRNLIFLPLIKPHFINYEAQGLRLLAISLVRRFSNIPILAWTIKSDENLSLVKEHCNNIVFESIDLGSN